MGVFKNMAGNIAGAAQKANSNPRIFISSAGPGVNPEQQNQIIKAWASKVARDLRRSARWFDEGKDKAFVQRKGRVENKLVRSIKIKYNYESGIVEYVGFSFERHGVFVHKGVGKGYRMAGNFVTKTAQTSSGKGRIAVEWFNPVLDEHLPELSNRLAEINANLAVNTVLAHIR